MYESFFGLEMLPFKITPDPQFIYWNKEHRRAASIIAFGIEQLVPITVVTGDVGTGKTTLLQQFLEETPADTTVGLISNYWSGMGGLYQWILNAFDLRFDGGDVELFRAFQDFVVAEYAAGRRCVLIVDEAQNMSDADLEQLRMLTNINSGKDSLMMLFLVGQHQLRDRLREPGNRQIAQRVGAAFHLGPMAREDTGNYIRHRISVAGGKDDIFDEGALDRIHDVTGGVPRMINVVCELALVTAFGDGVRTISSTYINEFLQEAEANGMIAHLPLSPDADPKPDPSFSPVSDPPPKSPVPIKRPGRVRPGAQAIRLVSELGTIEVADDTHPNVTLPAAKAPEEPPEKTAAGPAGNAPEQAGIMESVMAAQMAHNKASPETETTPVPDAAPPTEREDPVPEPADPEPVVHRSRLRGFLIGLTDHALHAALVLLAVGAVFALILQTREPTEPVAGLTTPAEPVVEPEVTEPTPMTAPAANTGASDPLDDPGGAALPEPVLSNAGTDPDDAGLVTPVLAVESKDTQPAPETAPTANTDAPVPLDDPGGAMLLERALSDAGADPGGAALSYARAALRGELKAAYYLGQMFETGAGVPQDLALARTWYEMAQDDVRSAKRRLKDLPDPETGGNLTPPVPVLGGPLTSGGAEYVWTSGDGPDPAAYLLETATAPDGMATRHAQQTLSALQTDADAAARVWRVIAADPATAQYAVSDWQHMGEDPSPAGTTPVAPQIRVFAPFEHQTLVQKRLQTAFPTASVTILSPADPAPAGPLVEYFYDSDAPIAEKIAGLLDNGAEVRMAERPLQDDAATPLPGEIRVVLTTP